MPGSVDEVAFVGLEEASVNATLAFIMQYRYHGQLFSVLISTDPPESCEREDKAIEFPWIERVDDLSYHDGTDFEVLKKQMFGEHEIADKIRDVVFSTLERLAPDHSTTFSASGPVGKSVADHLFPQFTKLQLVTKSGKLEVLSGHNGELERGLRYVPWPDMREFGFEPDSVPLFPARDVLLGNRLAQDAQVRDVYNITVPGIGEELVGKLVTCSVIFQQPIRRELEIYGKLRKLDLDPEARIPELKGLITHDDGVVGLIITKIPAKHVSLLPIVTGKLEDEMPARPLRQKWAAQIEHTVKELHRHGLVWGDAKPDNVVVDVDDNAWVLDFGGGYTEGWVEPSMFHTMEGDLYAVAKIKDGLQREDKAE